MNERDALRFAARRAAFLRALRDGDALAAARAGARLRLTDAALGPVELARARDARRTLGRAIVSARLLPPAASPPRGGSAITAPRTRGRRRALLALAILALVLLALLPQGAAVPGGGGSPRTAAAEQQRVTLATVSRGRTVALPAEIVVVAETAPPSPTPTPTEEPSPQPQRTSGASAAIAGGAGASGSTGAGGSGSGAGGGNGSGQGSGNGPGTASPTPVPVITLGPIPPGSARLVIIALDAQTRRPIADVCVVIGTANCLPGQPHTDANGRWAADVAASNAVTYWDVSLIHPSYTTVSRRLSLRAGSGSTTYSIQMRRTR